LQPGDLLSSDDGQWVSVEEVYDTGTWEQVYNVRVADHHTYFVGSLAWGFSVWAHNARCRYHTDAEGLAGIQKDNAINPSGPARGPVSGVHVELEPFGPVRSRIPGQSAVEEVGAANRRVQGYYVEFDVPDPNQLVPTIVGPRNTAIIPTSTPLSLEGLNPEFVRPKWWEFWHW